MNAKIRKGNLIIVLPLEAPRASATGKTLVVASSHGVKKTTSQVDGKTLCVVASAFVYPETTKRGPISPVKKSRKR
jgi:hypothetical protein